MYAEKGIKIAILRVGFFNRFLTVWLQRLKKVLLCFEKNAELQAVKTFEILQYRSENKVKIYKLVQCAHSERS